MRFTEQQIIDKFYVLASDTNPPGLRYCYLAPIWFLMAVAERSTDYSDGVSGSILRGMVSLQRDHERQCHPPARCEEPEAISQWYRYEVAA